MSLAAVPVFLWGRSLMATRWALVAAALTLALPGLAYSGLVMTEAVFYPVFVLAAWATAAALVSPTRGAAGAARGRASASRVATRLQAIVLLAVIVTAFVLDAAIARRRPQLRRYAVAARRDRACSSASGSSGGFAARRQPARRLRATRAARTRPATAARFVGYHLGDLALLTGVFPACALLVLAWRALRSGEEDAARARLRRGRRSRRPSGSCSRWACSPRASSACSPSGT